MTGSAPSGRLRELCAATGFPIPSQISAGRPSIFQSLPVRAVQYPQAYRISDPHQPAKRYTDALVELDVPELSLVSTEGMTLRSEPLTLAVLDTIHRLPQPAAVALIDAFRAGRHRLRSAGTEEDLHRWAEVLPSMRARSRTRRAWDLSDARAENPGESFSRVLIHQLGYDPPDLQTKLTLRDGTIAYVDFMWDSAGIAGEFDGDQKYLKAADFGMTAQEAVLKEKKREDAIRRLGYRVIRWDWSSLQDPRRLDRILNEAGVPRRRRTSFA